MTDTQATLVGTSAVGLWGALALFTTWTQPIQPFQLVAMTFTMAFALAATKWVLRGEGLMTHLRHGPKVWVFGVAGLFGYHFFYFMALRNAPAVDASLIAYLWPLLIVLFSALLPGERLRWFHIAGTLMGLGGCVLLVTDGGQVSFQADYMLGYGAALACALTWSSYSVLSRRFGDVPTDTVGWFCGATAILGLVCHLLFEQTVWPLDAVQWAAVAALGLGPVGIAFFTWDIGMKRGNIRVLGAFSYAAPLLSALFLVAFGPAEAGWTIAAACAAIVGGALLAASEIFKRSPQDSPS